MDRKKIASRCMIGGGAAELVIAVIHLLMPFTVAQWCGIRALPGEEYAFILLGILSVGLCLLVCGALSLFFSQKILAGSGTAWVYGISQGILFAGRTILELILPVRIPLFFVPNPTVWVLPLVSLVTLVFLVPLLAFRADLQKAG